MPTTSVSVIVPASGSAVGCDPTIVEDPEDDVQDPAAERATACECADDLDEAADQERESDEYGGDERRVDRVPDCDQPQEGEHHPEQY